MIQEAANPSVNMEKKAQGASIDQPSKVSRIPRRVDPAGQPMPGHRLDQPRPTPESMQKQQNEPGKPGILKQALPYLAPALAMGIGGGVGLYFGFSA